MNLTIYECWAGDGELTFLPADHPQKEFMTKDLTPY